MQLDIEILFVCKYLSKYRIGELLAIWMRPVDSLSTDSKTSVFSGRNQSSNFGHAFLQTSPAVRLTDNLSPLRGQEADRCAFKHG